MENIEELITIAQQGDSDAQYELGSFYENEKNFFEACKWFEEAAEQNHADSQFKLGYFCRWGDENFPADIEKGRFWLTQAAEQGHPKAQFHLGNLYNEEQRFDEAAKWFEKSAAQGEERAMFCFAFLNEAELFQGYNIKTAVEYYTILSEAYFNNIDAMVNLGVLYCSGEKIERDASKGKKLIERCKPLNKLDAYDCYRIGALYCSGEINPNKEPTTEDLAIGVELLDIAIKDGLADYHPGNIELANQLRDIAINRRAILTEMKDNNKIVQKLTDEYAPEDNVDYNKAKMIIEKFEEMYFRSTAFSEKTVREDLQIRKAMDTYSSFGSSGKTKELYNKQQVYYSIFNQDTSNLNKALKPINQLKKEHPDCKRIQEMISRFEKCLSQIDRLFNIVKNS